MQDKGAVIRFAGTGDIVGTYDAALVRKTAAAQNKRRLLERLCYVRHVLHTRTYCSYNAGAVHAGNFVLYGFCGGKGVVFADRSGAAFDNRNVHIRRNKKTDVFRSVFLQRKHVGLCRRKLFNIVAGMQFAACHHIKAREELDTEFVSFLHGKRRVQRAHHQIRKHLVARQVVIGLQLAFHAADVVHLALFFIQ